jgi:hypothetical protein
LADVPCEDLQAVNRLANDGLEDLCDHFEVAGQVRASLGGRQVYEDVDNAVQAGIPEGSLDRDLLFDLCDAYPSELETV